MGVGMTKKVTWALQVTRNMIYTVEVGTSVIQTLCSQENIKVNCLDNETHTFL